MDATAKKNMVKKYYDDVWCEGKLDTIDAFMSADYENCDPATPGGSIKGREAFKALVRSYREAFAHLKFDISEQWCEGSTVISRWTASGVHKGALMGIPPTGKQVTGLVGVTITDFADGRIVRDRAIWDVAGLMRQIGAPPG